MNPILNLDELKRLAAQWRLKSNKIVFTNGCFDVLHVGHLHTLTEAKKMGNKLIVALNSDASVKRLKGNKRPINQEHDRANLLAALQVIDAVILFEEDTPLRLIETLKPDVLVKGGDWAVDKIVGSEVVLNNGGEVHNVPFLEGYSSTGIIGKIKGL
ncbi:MAG: D-glycero-beta-D-manno-heptose 1-phosphate adenylyltransferase [Chitinophagales bacterium]|nr:D-glycero-beta-D-manno-heptose 1-phosphate adenylyltransferase [Chitinophagales bacterium]